MMLARVGGLNLNHFPLVSSPDNMRSRSITYTYRVAVHNLFAHIGVDFFPDVVAVEFLSANDFTDF